MLDVASSMVREVVALAEDEATRREVRRTRMRLQERGRSAAGSRKTLPDNCSLPPVPRARGGWHGPLHWRRLPNTALGLSLHLINSLTESVCAGRRIVPRLGGVQDQAKQRAGPGAPRSGAGGWDTAMPGTYTQTPHFAVCHTKKPFG